LFIYTKWTFVFPIFEQIAWNIWLSIGMESTKMSTSTSAKLQQQNSNGAETQEDFYIPSQAFLTALIQIFPAIFQHIQVKLVDTPT